MNRNSFALALGQTISYREPDHSYTSAKRNYTNLALMQIHQKIYAEHRHIIEVLISSAKTWYNSQKTEQVSLPAGLIFLCSPRERKRQILAQPGSAWAKPESKVLWEAWLCWAVPAPAAAPGAPLVAWLRGLTSKAVPPPHSQPSIQPESIFVLHGC